MDQKNRVQQKDSTDSAASALQDFWKNAVRLDRLKIATRLCISVYGSTPQALHNRGNRIKLREVPGDRTIKRFAEERDHHIRSPLHLTGLLAITAAILHEQSEHSDEASRLLSDSVRDLNEIVDLIPECFASQSDARKFMDKLSITETRVPDLTDFLHKFLQIPTEQVQQLAHELFPDIDHASLPTLPQQIYFDTYRFHDVPGHVVKTFTVIKSPTKQLPFPLFSNFFLTEEQGVPRRGDGFLVPTPRFIYFIGGFERGEGVKFMAAERRLHGKPPRFHGLLTTFDQNDDLICARFVMIKTDCTTYQRARSRILSPDEIKDEVHLSLEEIRNRVDFKLEKKLFLDKKPCSQGLMVDEIGHLLVRNGSPRLVDELGEEFNPASDDMYTFNSSLIYYHSNRNKK